MRRAFITGMPPASRPFGTATAAGPGRAAALLLRLRPLAAVALGLLLAGVPASPARGDTVYSNETAYSDGNPMTGGGYSVGQYPGGTSEYAIGWSFTVPTSTSYQFESGSFVASTEPPMPAGNVQLQLYSDNAGSPGTVLDTMIVPGSELGMYSAFLDFTSTTHPILSAGATYWLIASMPQSGTSSLWWTPSVSTPGYQAVSYDGGAFSVSPNPQGAFAIYGAAVPEPSSITMIATALAFALVRLRAGRRRRGAPRFPVERRSTTPWGAAVRRDLTRPSRCVIPG